MGLTTILIERFMRENEGDMVIKTVDGSVYGKIDPDYEVSFSFIHKNSLVVVDTKVEKNEMIKVQKTFIPEHYVIALEFTNKY